MKNRGRKCQPEILEQKIMRRGVVHRNHFYGLVMAALQDYVKDAEHANGIDYWLDSPPEELARDFGLYLQKWELSPDNYRGYDPDADERDDAEIDAIAQELEEDVLDDILNLGEPANTRLN